MNSSTSSLLIDGLPILFSVPLAQHVGLKEAIMLQKIHYWLHPNRNQNFYEGHPWVHNTYDQWRTHFPFWSTKTIFRIIRRLEKQQILLSYRQGETAVRTKYYTINYGILGEWGITSKGDSGSNQEDLEEQTPLHPPKTLAQSSSNQTVSDQTIPGQMVAQWNEWVQVYTNPGHPISLSPKRGDALEAFLTQECQGDLSAWDAYCQTISQTRFLMGDNDTGFRITLDWALNPHNGRKILSGHFFDRRPEERGDRIETRSNQLNQSIERIQPATLPWDAFDRLLDRQMINTTANTTSASLGDPWREISKNLARRIGQAAYTSWFGTVCPVSLTDDTLTLQVKRAFSRDRIIEHYEVHLLSALRDVLGGKHQVHYTLSSFTGDTP